MTGPEPRPSEGYVRFVLGMIFCVILLSSVDRTVLSILVQDVKQDLDLTDRQMGWLLGPAFTIFYTLTSFPLAAWADGGRRRLVISIGLFFWSLFTVLTSIVTGFWSLFFLRMGVGVGEASASAPGQSLITGYVAPEKRARSLSVIAIGGVLGLAIGMIVGGYVSEWRGWRMAFVVAGTPGLVFALVFYLTVREPERIERPVTWQETVRTMWQIRTYRWIVVGQSTALFASLGRNLWEPTFLRRVYEMGAGEAGLWYFLTSPLPSAFGIYLGGRLADGLWLRDKRWSMWTPALGQLVTIPLLSLFLLWPEDHRLPLSSIEGGFPVALLFSVAASISGSLYAAPMLSVSQGLAPVAMRARAAAIASAIGATVGSGFGPLVVGELNMHFEPIYGAAAIRYSLLAIVATTIVSAICWYAASRPLLDDFQVREGLED